MRSRVPMNRSFVAISILEIICASGSMRPADPREPIFRYSILKRLLILGCRMALPPLSCLGSMVDG